MDYNKIKLIVLDVDGTLLNSRNELLPSTVTALQEAADRGIHIVLSTGRMLSECRELLAQLPMIRYIVSCTGSQTIDLQNERTIGRKSLTRLKVYAGEAHQHAAQQPVSLEF